MDIKIGEELLSYHGKIIYVVHNIVKTKLIEENSGLTVILHSNDEDTPKREKSQIVMPIEFLDKKDIHKWQKVDRSILDNIEVPEGTKFEITRLGDNSVRKILYLKNGNIGFERIGNEFTKKNNDRGFVISMIRARILFYCGFWKKVE